MEERKNSAARIRANNKYAAKAYDRINIAVPKGRKDAIQECALQRGESINAFIGRLILEAMERDSDRTALTSSQQPAETAQGARAASLSPDTMEAAQRGAGRTGESVAAFVARAVAAQEKRDENSLKLGINPA